MIRATPEEKEAQIQTLQNLHKKYASLSDELLHTLQVTAIKNENIFEKLMDAAKHCSLGQITHALYEVGGQYRRNM